MIIRLRFAELLRERGITPNRLWRASRLSRNTIYALTKGDRARVDLEVLAIAMEALAKESGQPVTINDIFATEDVKTTGLPDLLETMLQNMPRPKLRPAQAEGRVGLEKPIKLKGSGPTGSEIIIRNRR